MKDFELKEVKITDLHCNKGQIPGVPKNPRTIKDERFRKLVKSLQDAPEMLHLREVIAYDNNGELVVICGNQRLAAAKEAGLKTLPTKILPQSTPAEKLREYTIKDNVAFGEDDWEVLNSDWDKVECEDWGMDWTEEEVEEKPDVEVKEDDYDPSQEVASVVSLGDIWQLGEHRLMCGDSTKEESVEKLMDGEEGGMCWLTDPPYNVALGYEGSASEARQRHRQTDGKIILNDKMPDEAFRGFLKQAYIAAFKALRPGASYYIWHASNEAYNFAGALRDCGVQLRQILVWNKNAITLGRQDYQWKHELCLYGWKEGASHSWYSDRKQATVMDFNKPTISKEHPTMKPIALFAYLIQNSTRAGDVVLDTFGGSGTTLVACEQLGRRCRMMELDPHYCDVIIDRWQKLTGKTAVKIS